MEASTAFVVILGYCSITSGDCSAIAAANPGEQPWVQTECRAYAKQLNANKELVEGVLFESAVYPPPWVVNAKCGTNEQFLDIVAAMSAGLNQREGKP